MYIICNRVTSIVKKRKEKELKKGGKKGKKKRIKKKSLIKRLVKYNVISVYVFNNVELFKDCYPIVILLYTGLKKPWIGRNIANFI